MKWLERTLATQAQVIAQLHSQSDSSQSEGAELALVCTDHELIAWNGQTEQRLPLREVKKFSREGLELLIFDANSEALRLPILSAPRAEIDAFFAALKPAIARTRTLPVTAKAVEPAPIAPSEFKLKLSPETVQVAPQVQTPAVAAQAKNVVLETEKEFSFDLGPLMAPASAPAMPTPIAEPAPQGEMVFELGALIAPLIAPKPVPVPKPKVESAPVLEPEPAVTYQAIADQAVVDQAAQAWPEVFGSIAPPEPVQVASTPVQTVTEAKLPPMAEVRPVTVPKPIPISSPHQLQAPVSSTPAASSSPVAEAEVVVPVGRGQAASETKKADSFDTLFDAPKPKRELPPRVLAQDFGNGLFMHENGFKYQLASIGERFLAMLVDSFLMGILNRVLTAMTLSSVNAHVARLQILVLDASTTDPTKSAALTLERETLMRNVPGEMLQAVLLSAFLTLIATWLYFAFFESGPKQATPGKTLMKIGVTDLNIARISFLRATRRFAWRIGPFYVTLMIAFVTAGSQLYSGTSGAVAAAFSLMIWVVISTLLLFGGLLTAAFTKRRQTVHDLLAQTLVVKA
jgi:uncharacterized RDD family membrane protein YckC